MNYSNASVHSDLFVYLIDGMPTLGYRGLIRYQYGMYAVGSFGEFLRDDIEMAVHDWKFDFLAMMEGIFIRSRV